ncbi:OLC1v1014212C2 [Oldenlandia corymbosa var. corymbosa]|uniref:OLC1v1014212C2 n=1 Tax=Oldenlandia corymbosa var. corymbosa TaxID=529605 RepID=A0AAV1E3S0_OLDCO|nr:OLC1v1014212C2 [Oldenlandia corymbosa var. corymbosa]
MGRGRYDRAPPSEERPTGGADKPKKRQLYECDHRIAVRQKFRSSNGETKQETETLTSSSSVVLKTCSSSHNRGHADRIKRKRKLRRKKNKLLDAKDGRRWTYSTSDFSKCKDRIVFVSYNILGVGNASKHPDLYRKVPPEYLNWDYRKRILYKEIKSYKAGIMCLQEVDRFEDLGHLLKKNGFKGVYKGRTGEALDGCATFWNADLFTLLHEESIEFQSYGLRNNACQICVFKMNSDRNSQEPTKCPSRSFVVGNIHLLFNPSRGDIKLGQMRLFLQKAHTLSHEWGNIPVVIAGDFNSMPQSPMYQFLTSSELNIQLHDRKQISGQICPLDHSSQNNGYLAASGFASRYPSLYRWTEDELRLASGSASGHLRHSLKLCSTYVGVPGSTQTRNYMGEPLATSFHSKFMGTVDYIWCHSPCCSLFVFHLPYHPFF